jgi:hypothetical protein
MKEKQKQQQQTTVQQQEFRPLLIAVLTAPGNFSYEEKDVDVEVRNMSKSFYRLRRDREAWKNKLRAVLRELKTEPVPQKIVICVYPNWIDAAMLVILTEFGPGAPVEVWTSRLTDGGAVFEPPIKDEVFS